MWIGIYQEFLLVFRMPLQFDKLVGGCMKYVDEDKTRIYSNTSNVLMNRSTVICSNIMRAGKHTSRV